MGKKWSLQFLLALNFFLTLHEAEAMPTPAQFRVQNRDTVLGAKSLRSIKVVPDYAARVVPTGGKTKFYGEAEIKIGRKPVSILRVHFFEWKLKASADARNNGRCAIDLYLQTDHRNAFRMISSIKDESDETGINKSFGFPVTFVNLIWLNNKTKTIPVIRFCCQATGGFYGPVGQNLFLIFANGLTEKPSMQNFENYSSHIDFVDWFFDGMDATGNRQFIQLIDPLGEGEDKYIFWNWNEKEAVFQAQTEAKANKQRQNQSLHPTPFRLRYATALRRG